MPRVLAILIAMAGLIFPFSLSGLFACGSCPAREAIECCCEEESAATMPCCTERACDQHCSGCVCAKRVEPPSTYPRGDRESELPSQMAVLAEAMSMPAAEAPATFTVACRATESPPHLGALKTIRLAI